jgi:uncharacterized protein (TIGR00255 family)
MPIHSMTGFARVQVRVHDQLGYTLSVKSVNHRFLDAQVRLPSGMEELEMDLRKMLKEKLVRGHVELTLTVDRSGQQRAGYNRELVSAYFAAFAAMRDEYGTRAEPDLNAVLRLPGALQQENRGEEDLPYLAASALSQIEPLLEQLTAMRAREGEALEAILYATMDRLAEATNGVGELRPDIEQRYQDRLAQRLLAATGLTRMHMHIDHFRALLATDGEVGKKLDFLLQEMNREANTLLSKTSGVAGQGTRITELGLAMKAEIEKAREQIQNVE